jgi:hypothetical protein
LPEVTVALLPEDKGVDSLARQIKLTGRAYPLFEIARLVLKKADRYLVKFSVVKKPDGQVAQPLFLCNLDETLWLNEDDTVAHVLAKHFATFYQVERVATEPPKGTYTFVAQCALSGVILGPPNYHDYQAKLRKLHQERFAHLPFDVYKGRVRIVRDEAVVKKWLEEASFKAEYTCLNVPEAPKLHSRDEVERHFREVHKPNVVQSVENYTLHGSAALALPCQPLRTLVRLAVEDQQKFPIRVVNVLSQQFAAHALQFFKVNKTVTHVAVARPHYLDVESTPVSEGCRRIIEFVNAHPRCTRRHLLEALMPAAAVAPAPVAAADTPGEQPITEAAPPAQPHATPTVEAHEPTPAQALVIGDLHWLIHQGHVIEFSDGFLETAKPPPPKPPRPSPAPPQAAAPPAATVSEPLPEIAPAPPAVPPEGEPTAEPAGPEALPAESAVGAAEPPATPENESVPVARAPTESLVAVPAPPAEQPLETTVPAIV